MSPAKVARATKWHADYDAYLKTPAWKVIRTRRLARDNGLCVCGVKATQVHHLTYARVGHEELGDLRSVCDRCHYAIHHMVRVKGWSLHAASEMVFHCGATVKVESRRQPRKPNRRRRRKRAKRPDTTHAQDMAAMKLRNAARVKEGLLRGA